MRVVLTGEMSGTRDGQEWPPRGSTIDLPDDEAIRMIDTKMAIPAPVDGDIQMAVMPGTDVEQRALTTDSAPALGRKRTK